VALPLAGHRTARLLLLSRGHGLDREEVRLPGDLRQRSGSANYTVFHRRFLSPVRRRLLKLLLDGKQSRAWDVRYALARKKSLIEKDRDWVIAHST
jgi:hypothetical protein